RHEFRLTADKDLEFRMPVKAGPRLISVVFSGLPAVSERLPLRAGSIKTSVATDDFSAPGVATIEIAGPYGAQPADDTPSRRRIFVCRPAVARDEVPCAEKIFRTLARRAYRRPVTTADVQGLLALYRRGRGE